MKKNTTGRADRIILWLAITLTQALAGCSAQPTTAPLMLHDYAYGPDSLQTMDVYLAANRTLETPLLILMHGGGWMTGDKRDFNYMKDSLHPLGINVVNLNYRLANQAGIHYPAIMTDLSMALDHLGRHADTWQIRSTKWVIWGNSAGGHLALLYAYNHDTEQRISAAISFAGPVKLGDDSTMREAKPQDINGLLPLITGKPYVAGHLDGAYREASPYYGNRYIPTLLIHGDRDDIVPMGQSRLMHERLLQENIPTDFIVLENGDHGGGGATESSQRLFHEKALFWISNYSK